MVGRRSAGDRRAILSSSLPAARAKVGWRPTYGRGRVQLLSPTGSRRMDVTTTALSRLDRAFLLGLQRQAIGYFLDNQAPSGLVLDRQRNRGPRLGGGLCS